MESWEDTKLRKPLSHRDLCYSAFFFFFLNRLIYKATQAFWISAHGPAFLKLPQKKKILWAFESEWQKWGTSKLNDESIIEQVACEKMSEWRWKWMADRGVRRAPRGKELLPCFYCYSSQSTHKVMRTHRRSLCAAHAIKLHGVWLLIAFILISITMLNWIRQLVFLPVCGENLASFSPHFVLIH